jgi:flagellar M-ring protein FliF
MLGKFTELPIGQRLGILMVLAAGLAALAGAFMWTQQAEMGVLFANLAQDDAGAIVEKLKELKVPYEIGGGGSSIHVPSPQVHDLRLQLAGQGLPHGGGVGFEIFDRTTVGMSEFVQKLNYRRALQGELARTMAQMPEVEKARVHLAVPERRLFATEQDRARASVVLSLRRGQQLTKGQVQGVVHLVASSVESLQPQNVTVIDGHGRILSEGAGADGPTRLSGSQLEYQRNLETDIETRVKTILEPIVGINKAVVRVSAMLDLRQVELTEERFDPNGQVVRSENRSQEKASGTNSTGGGIPGVASNVPPGDALDGGPSNRNDSQSKNETINYDISRTVSRIVEPYGTIKKLSVAVLVDGSYTGAGQGADESQRKYVPRTEQDMKKLEELVKKAMGYSSDRQDQVEVANMPFGFDGEEPGATTADASVSVLTLYAPYIRYGVGALLFIMILFLVVRPLVATLTAKSETQLNAAMALPQNVGMTVSQIEQATQGDDPAKIIEMAKSDPQSTALVVKKWLNPKEA